MLLEFNTVESKSQFVDMIDKDALLLNEVNLRHAFSLILMQ